MIKIPFKKFNKNSVLVASTVLHMYDLCMIFQTNKSTILQLSEKQDTAITKQKSSVEMAECSLYFITMKLSELRLS